MTPDRIAETHAVTVAIESRIAVLWKQRQRDRIRADWSPARHDRETELRALLRLLHVGRRLARQTLEREKAPWETRKREYDALQLVDVR